MRAARRIAQPPKAASIQTPARPCGAPAEKEEQFAVLRKAFIPWLARPRTQKITSAVLAIWLAGLTWTRMKTIADRYLPFPRILHPWPEKRFLVTIQGGSPVR
jgi:hypothetical protein